MLTSLLILCFGLTPSVISLWFLRHSRAESQARLQHAMESVHYGRFTMPTYRPDQQYVEGLGLVVGNIRCQYNARSPYIRCAINPSGPCDECSHFEERPLP